MSDVAIRVEGLGKRYRIGGPKERYRTLRDQIGRAVSAPLRALRRRGEAADDRTFWALRDVSFEVKRGEVVGIIGRNGAGKSTLLKILSRITEPTTGEVALYGRVGSLLEVGTGFHPELTGRENVFLNGAILGMKREEIARKFDEIVAFAEVEKFIDTPVKHYSSGMYMRLAFAVAAHLEPEILVVDEVLAVGDAAFQQKCLGKMGEVSREGRTVLFVSHNTAAVTRLCTSGYWLDSGKVRGAGPAAEIVTSYLLTQGNDAGEARWPEGVANAGESAMAFLGVQLVNGRGEASSQFFYSEAIRVRITFRVNEPLSGARVGLYVSSADGAIVLEAYDSDRLPVSAERAPGVYVASALLPEHLLNEASYLVSLNAGIPGARNLAHLQNVLSFRVDNPDGAGAYLGEKRAGCIFPRLHWELERGE
jgi:lipopolysaccharide transport system ATP-binding protein